MRLIPLQLEHADSLFAIAEGQNIWRWYPDSIQSLNDMRAFIAHGLSEVEQGLAIAFTMVESATNTIVGSTQLFNISPPNSRVEIGKTWVGLKWQGTKVNTESKYLLMQYAFKSLNCVRVELKTDSRNVQSRGAMLKLGLKQEGILRSHMITHDGYVRDTVYFSVIDKEWPDMKKSLEAKLLS